MAGSQDPNDNPVAINVVPMVDVIFCLCVFFMCSMKFKQIEGKFDSWLPKDAGIAGPTTNISEMRVALFWDEQGQRVRRQFGQRLVADDAELETLLRGAHEDSRHGGARAAPLTIDGEARVPWRAVVDVVNLARGLGIADVRFALGAAER